MNCPICGNNLLHVRMLFSGYVKCCVDEAGGIDVVEPVQLGSHVSSHAPCRCDACGWEGPVLETGARDPAGGLPDALADGDVLAEELEALLASGRLDRHSATALERLLREYSELRSRA